MRFNILGIRFSVSYLAVFLVTFSIVSATTGQDLVFLCILCAVFHETGHLIFICVYGNKPEKIVINLFEVRICTPYGIMSKKADIMIASGGIICNILFLVFAFTIYYLFSQDYLYDFAMCNLFIGGMNLLPIESFDGGQILYLCLHDVIGDKRTHAIIIVLTIILMFPIAVASIFVLFESQHNYSLLFVFLYLLSIFISKNCGD